MKITRTAGSVAGVSTRAQSALEECGPELKVDCVIGRLERHQKGNIAHFELDELSRTDKNLRALSGYKGKTMDKFEAADASRSEVAVAAIALPVVGLPIGLLVGLEGGTWSSAAMGLGIAASSIAMAVLGIRHENGSIRGQWREGLENPRSDLNPEAAPQVKLVEIRERHASASLKEVAKESLELFQMVARTVEEHNDKQTDLAPLDKDRVAIVDQKVRGGKVSAIASLDEHGRVRGLKAHIDKRGDRWLTASRDPESGRLSVYEKSYSQRAQSLNLNREVEEHIHVYQDSEGIQAHSEGWERAVNSHYISDKREWNESGVVTGNT